MVCGLAAVTQKPPSTEVHLDAVNEQAHDYVRQAATLISAKPQSQAFAGNIVEVDYDSR